MSSSVCSHLRTLFSKTPKPKPKTTTATATTTSTSTAAATSEFVESFKKRSDSIRFRRNIPNYNASVRHLAAGKNFSAIESILEYQKQYIADEGFGVRLIKLYGKIGMFDHAYKVFDELPKLNCPRTVMSFNALLGACVNSKNLDKVWELFVELREKLGIEPDVVSYNTVLQVFCKSGHFDSALELIEKMEENEVWPDLVSYNTVLDAYYKRNKINEAFKLWNRMEEKGVIPSVRTYNSKLRCLVKNDQVQEALELVEKMVNDGVKLDNYSYSAVIRGCVFKENLDEAKMYYRKMVGDGCCFPDHTTYEMLIPFACDKNDIDFALELCKHSVESKISIDKLLMERMVDALIKISKVEEATELVELVNSSAKRQYTIALPVTT